MSALKACPLCGTAPNRFVVGQQRIEVIACRKGCKPNWNSVVVHIRSVDVEGCGWSDLGDAWNTIEVYQGEDGLSRVRFDRYAPGHGPVEPDGLHMRWSPEISARHAQERAAVRQTTGGSQL